MLPAKQLNHLNQIIARVGKLKRDAITVRIATTPRGFHTLTLYVIDETSSTRLVNGHGEQRVRQIAEFHSFTLTSLARKVQAYADGLQDALDALPTISQ